MYGSDVSPAQSAAHQQARISRAHERRVGSRRPVPPAEEGAQAPHRTPAVQTPESRSEEHTSEPQSPCNLVCRLLLEKKKKHAHLPKVRIEHHKYPSNQRRITYYVHTRQ